MSATEFTATYDEYMDFLDQLSRVKKFPYAKEWHFAREAKWDQEEYIELYKKYIFTTQRTATSEENKTESKGNPFELLARYFLKHGGIVHDIKELKSGSRWQVDGHGTLNKSNLESAWCSEMMSKIGYQLYLECKNKIDPATKQEFNDHCIRMEDNDCYLGIMASTSGFKITRGRGIAERVYTNHFKNRYNLLLTVRDFDLVIEKNMPPMKIITDALTRTTSDMYRSDPETIEQYTIKHCHKVAQKRASAYSYEDAGE